MPPGPFSLGEWDVKSCAACGFTYITSAPDYEALFEQMAWEKSSKAESERRAETRAIQQKLSKKTRWRLHLFPRKKMPDLFARFVKPGPVVDLGCGTGGQFDGLDSGFIPYGVEISSALAAEADRRFREKGGYCVNAPSLEGLKSFPAHFFTGASLRSYLEHELNPQEVLRELHRVMAQDGVVIVKVPNFGSLNRLVMGNRWCGFRHPDHLNYFTPASLQAMARQCGFKTWFGAGWRMPTSDNMWALLRKA